MGLTRASNEVFYTQPLGLHAKNSVTQRKMLEGGKSVALKKNLSGLTARRKHTFLGRIKNVVNICETRD